jgi:hypothetical protein
LLSPKQYSRASVSTTNKIRGLLTDVAQLLIVDEVKLSFSERTTNFFSFFSFLSQGTSIEK